MRTWTIASRATAAACCTRWKRRRLAAAQQPRASTSTSASSTSGAIVAITSASSSPRKMPDRREHHRAEHDQREDVEQRLGDERAEHDREAVAHAAEPARHDQRARGLAEPRRQRGRHQDADHRAARGVAAADAHARAARRAGSRARPRRAPASRRTSARRPRAPRSAWRPAATRPIDSIPIRSSARAARPTPRDGARADDHAPRRRAAAPGAGRAGASGSSEGSRRGAHARPRLGGRRARARAASARGAAARAAAAATRLLVDARRPRSATLRPGEALGALARGARPCAARRCGSSASVAQRLAELGGVAAAARARRRRRRGPRRGSRRCREPTTGVPDANASVSTMPKLSPPSDGAHEQVGLAEQAPLLLLGHAPGDLDALGVEQQRLDLLGSVAPATVRRASTPAPRSASKARSSTGRPLRSSARPTNSELELARRGARSVAAAPRVRSTPFGTIR